eukprot:6172414-Pleurochrysis_carterae.AAC.2
MQASVGVCMQAGVGVCMHRLWRLRVVLERLELRHEISVLTAQRFNLNAVLHELRLEARAHLALRLEHRQQLARQKLRQFRQIHAGIVMLFRQIRQLYVTSASKMMRARHVSIFV